jgi:hypothetical protein
LDLEHHWAQIWGFLKQIFRIFFLNCNYKFINLMLLSPFLLYSLWSISFSWVATGIVQFTWMWYARRNTSHTITDIWLMWILLSLHYLFDWVHFLSKSFFPFIWHTKMFFPSLHLNTMKAGIIHNSGLHHSWVLRQYQLQLCS